MISENVQKDKKTLGIIGGMGPLATADLFHKIVSLTDADSDEEHIRIVIDNNPKIPDRTKAILCGSDEPFAYILKTAQRLEHMGADILLLPCNTSHIFYQRLCEPIHTPIINMIEETSRQVYAMKLGKVGLLATSGTLHAKLYENALDNYGIDTVLPSDKGQAEVMALIYKGIKAGSDKFDISAINEELCQMTAQGAETFILGCTELPVAFQKYGINFPFIDPTVILAKTAIAQSGYSIR